MVRHPRYASKESIQGKANNLAGELASLTTSLAKLSEDMSRYANVDIPANLDYPDVTEAFYKSISLNTLKYIRRSLDNVERGVSELREEIVAHRRSAGLKT